MPVRQALRRQSICRCALTLLACHFFYQLKHLLSFARGRLSRRHDCLYSLDLSPTNRFVCFDVGALRYCITATKVAIGIIPSQTQQPPLQTLLKELVTHKPSTSQFS